jgi:hypothetical protein
LLAGILRKLPLELSAGSAPHPLRYAAGAVDEHRCIDDQLCDGCYGRAMLARRGQADAIGQVWAERVCRGELRARAAWPEHEPKTLAIARGLVARLARDLRLLEALARVCSAGAAAWWQHRPAQYRIETTPATWSLVTAPDERERCCVVIGGERCSEPTAYRIAAEDGALDDYTHVCRGHRELVAGPGYAVMAVEQGPGENRVG